MSPDVYNILGIKEAEAAAISKDMLAVLRSLRPGTTFTVSRDGAVELNNQNRSLAALLNLRQLPFAKSQAGDQWIVPFIVDINRPIVYINGRTKKINFGLTKREDLTGETLRYFTLDQDLFSAAELPDVAGTYSVTDLLRQKTKGETQAADVLELIAGLPNETRFILSDAGAIALNIIDIAVARESRGTVPYSPSMAGDEWIFLQNGHNSPNHPEVDPITKVPLISLNRLNPSGKIIKADTFSCDQVLFAAMNQ